MADASVSNVNGLNNSSDNGTAAATLVTLRIRVPDTKAEKCLQFDSSATVYSAKLKALEHLGRGLTDRLNYGLYLPDSRGRAGKFLQEERLLSEYPMSGTIGDVELRYKRRLYRNPSLSTNKIKRANSSSNLKHFVQSLQSGDTTAVNMHLSSGLDPNVRCKSNGATALMLAAELKRSREMILTLISGGAFLDFRDSKGLTAMHLAAIIGNGESVQTLLDLGQSPNCLDERGLTPLYHSILHSGSTVVAEMLLYDGSCLGVTDDNGLCEIHQACKLGREHHLELLLTYGADINSTTTLGNTPLHVSALANQLECARILLRRGADKQIKNYQGNNAEDAALLAANQRLAELIRNFSPAEVTPIEVRPRLNTRRRRLNSGNLGGGQSLSQASRGWGSMASIGSAQYQLYQQHQQTGRSHSTVFNRDLSMGRLSVSSSMAAGLGAVGSNSTSRSSPVFPTGQPDSLPAEQLARTVVIQRNMAGGAGGFGFVLKGSRTPITAGWGSNATSSRQILGPIEPGKPASLAGMRQSDLVLEINGVDVREFSHAECLQLITGDTLALKLITPPTPLVRDGHSQSVLSVQSDTEPLRAIDMLDRTLNCYEEIPEDPSTTSASADADEKPDEKQDQAAKTESAADNAEADSNSTKNDVRKTSETELPKVTEALVEVATVATVAAVVKSPKETVKKEPVDDGPTEPPKAEVAEAEKVTPDIEPLQVEQIDDLPVPEGFGNEAEQQNSDSPQETVETDDGEKQIDRKISTIAPLPTGAPPPPPPTVPPPPPPKPSIGTPSSSAAIVRRRSMLAKPAAATPDHDQELRRLVELRRKKIDSGQLDPSQQIEAQLNRKSAGSRKVIVPAASTNTVAAASAESESSSVNNLTAGSAVSTIATPSTGTAANTSTSTAPNIGTVVAVNKSEQAASTAIGNSAKVTSISPSTMKISASTGMKNSPTVTASSSGTTASTPSTVTLKTNEPVVANSGSSSPVQLRRSTANPLANVAAVEATAQRPSSFTSKAEQLRQLILQQHHQQQQHKTQTSEL